MEDASAVQDGPVAMEEDEEVDPLDAFMDNLDDPYAAPKMNGNFSRSQGKRRQQEPELLVGDDEVDLKALENDPDDILAITSKRKKKDLPSINYAKLDWNRSERTSIQNQLSWQI